MKTCFAYTRVSTAKQGEGVSLQEQRAAIERYVARNDIEISTWFEERVSAAKRGRPEFSKMLRKLRAGKATGVVIHKIDRSARNLRDWAELGELIDAGIAVHFADESLDMLSRSGRLSADIQAVVAADYIRNLREETRKGFYGRLKQGLYPLPAPVGYINQGAGKPKTIDPVKGPLVRSAFELYDTGQYTLAKLAKRLRALGLRRRRGSALYPSALSVILNNPFYTGIIRIRSTGETFSGIHKPLIKKSLFDRVQARLGGKRRSVAWKHDYLFRGLFRCSECGRLMTPERQKGHIYYRCHERGCPTKCVREEVIDGMIEASLRQVGLPKEIAERMRTRLADLASQTTEDRAAVRKGIQVQLEQLQSKSDRLTDALIDGLIGKDVFDERKAALLAERARLEENLEDVDTRAGRREREIDEVFELAMSAQLTYKHITPAHKRELLERVSSNRTLGPQGVAVELREPFQLIADWHDSSNGGAYRNDFRTCDALATRLSRWFVGYGLASQFGRVVL